jgi:predicted transcriptional regulator with HTH domain
MKATTLMNEKIFINNRQWTVTIHRYEKELINLNLLEVKYNLASKTYDVVDNKKFLDYVLTLPEVNNSILRRKYKSVSKFIAENKKYINHLHAFLLDQHKELAKKDIIVYETVQGRNFYYVINEEQLVIETDQYIKNKKENRYFAYDRPYKVISDLLNLPKNRAQNLFKSIQDSLIETGVVSYRTKNKNTLYKIEDKERFLELLRDTEEYNHKIVCRKYISIHSLLLINLDIQRSRILYLIHKLENELTEKGLIEVCKVRSKRYYYSKNDKEIIKVFSKVIEGGNNVKQS